MNILFISSSFKGGGINSYALEVINCFKDKHNISVIIGDDSRSPLEGVKVYHCEARKTSFRNARKMLQLVNNIRPNVIINSFGAVFTLILPYIPNDIMVITVSHSLRYNEADVAGIKAVAIFDVSDNTIDAKSLYSGRTKQDTQLRTKVKQQIIPEITLNLLNR